MGFWIFGNKKEGKEAHERIDQVHRVLKNSFENVKEDIAELGGWQRTLEMSHKEHKYKIEEINQRLKRIENYIFSLNNQRVELKQVQKKEIEKEELEGSASKDVLNILTATQVNMFVKLYQLQKQVGSKISYKSLASILYKDKNYNEVRSTLSEYISFLVDHDLVRKYRKGKESYAGITDRGLELLEQLNEEEIQEIEKKKD